MSETDGAPRVWRLYVNDMIEFSENVWAYTAGLDEDGFLSDRRTYDATLRNLELIGEAATHIPESVRNARPKVPWRSIIGMRNRLIHGYSGVDDELVWRIVQEYVPALSAQLRNLLDSADEENAWRPVRSP